MEPRKTKLPIYKICHLRSPNEFKESTIEPPRNASASAEIAGSAGEAAPNLTTITNNVLYVFFGDIEFMNDDGMIININEFFYSEPENEFFKDIFSEYELNSIKETNIKVIFLPEKIYPDDSIETIKKKFLIYTRTTLRLTYGELYFFCKQAKTLTNNHVNDQLTSNGKMEITPIRIQNFLLNIDNHPREVVNYGGTELSEDEARQFTDFTTLGEPTGFNGNYGYANILNLKLDEKPRFMNVVMGQELSSVSHDYPYAINPFDSLHMDPFLESHISEIINTTNKTVILDFGIFILHNTIYLTTASDVLEYTRSLNDPANREELGIDSFPNARVMNEKYAIQLYYPYLAIFRDEERRSLLDQRLASSAGDSDLSTIHSIETLNMHHEKLYEADNKILNERFMKQTSNVKLLYDIYERRTMDHNYIDDGIRGIEFIINPQTKYNLSLDSIFKKIHCEESIPFIKYNPGKRLDNIYKFFTSGTSKSGRKIPYLPKSDIFRLMKTVAIKKGVAVYINYTYSNPAILNHKATHLSIPVICEIEADGSVHVKTYFKHTFSIDEVTEIIKATINPTLTIIKEYIEQSGYNMNLFTNFYNENIEIVNVEYFSQLAITRNIEIKSMIKCISSVFNEIEGSLLKGILLRYKRVSNYNDMTSQEAYIVEMLNKRHSDREIIDGLRENYMLEEESAKLKIAGLLNSIQMQQLSRYRGGNIRIKNNPGFLTKITKGKYNNIISVEISNINNLMFLPSLQMFIDSIIRIYQNPGTTDVPYEKINELCRGVGSGPVAAPLTAKKDRLKEAPALSSSPSDRVGSELEIAEDVANVSDIQLSEDGGELRSFITDTRNEAVVKEVNTSAKEADVDGVADITSITRKSFPESVSSAVIGERVVFGFEAQKEQVKEADFEQFFGLMDDDEEEGEEEGEEGEEEGEEEGANVGGGLDKYDNKDNELVIGGAKASAVRMKKTGASGGVAVSHVGSSALAGEDIGIGKEDEGEDMSDITGMELTNPNPFSKRIQERDPIIHLNEDSGKFNAYSRSCPWNYRRQPVILTNEEKERIDKDHPGSYSQSITYGSDPKNQYNYICPRYWSLKHNTSLTEDEVKSGKYGSVIPQKAKKIPKGASIFEFTDDKYHLGENGEYKQHYPGFLKKDAHPKGLCVPCCFSQWDKPSQTQRRQECEIKQHESVKLKEKPKGANKGALAAAAINAPNVPEDAAVGSSAALQMGEPAEIGKNQEEAVKISEMKDDRILSSEKFPLDNNRWGYLPVQVQKFLFTDNRNCQVSLKNSAIKKDTPCLIRRGVEANEKQSFVSVITYYYMENVGAIKTTAALTSQSSSGALSGIAPSFPSNMAMSEIIAESVSANTASGGNVVPGKIDSFKLRSMLAAQIEKTSMQLKQQQPPTSSAASTPTATSAVSAVSAVSEQPPMHGVSAGMSGASAKLQPEEVINVNYESEDETPIPMTPRALGQATPSAFPMAYSGVSSGVPSSAVISSSDYVPTIREMLLLIIKSLDIDRFITLQNGTLVDVFYNSKNEIHERDLHKYKTSEIYKKLQGQPAPDNTKVLFHKMCNAFENFISYLSDDDVVIDHTYLWDIVSQPNPKLFKNGNNIILIHIPDDDITNNVQVICPTNSYSGEVFDSNKKTIIIMKRDKYYEPIYSFESKSNGKFNVLGRFAIKSKTIMPKIKHVIETIRDLYFSYCRLHSSQPRQYKYAMNKPAMQIAKLLKDSGFEILYQVMNYNGKIIGLRVKKLITITKTEPTNFVKKSIIRKMYGGVIPTAASAPIIGKNEMRESAAKSQIDVMRASEAVESTANRQSYEYPLIMMDDDDLWRNNYEETIEFLNRVAEEVKKNTKQTIYCRPKVKVVEEGIVIGIITETNQFIQVNIDENAQLNQDDGIPTITEGNQLVAEKEIAMKKHGSIDKVREKYVRNIRLETNFYNVFRNTARIAMNKPENTATKYEIEKILNSPFIIYSNKLSKIVELMKTIMKKYVSFIKYSKDTLKIIGEISGCISSDDKTCSSKNYCMKESGGLCKLLIPQRNLMYHEIDNSILYFGKITDEIIRYERVKLFMFEPAKYLSFQETRYDLDENEIILLESLITQDYFENLEPADYNPYSNNNNFYTVNPNQSDGAMIQVYDNLYRKGYVDSYMEKEKAQQKMSLESREPSALSSGEFLMTGRVNAVASGAKMLQASGIELFNIKEINHVLDFCSQVSKRKVPEKMKQLFFPNDAFEILFSNESEECSFDVILTILRAVAQNASKCPSGHTCQRARRNQSLSSLSTAQLGTVEENEVCNRCRSSIGMGDVEFTCVRCNYFVCDNCQHQHVDKLGGITVIKLKEILVGEYEKLARIPTFGKKLVTILNGYGMRKYANIILEGRATFGQIVQSENYFLTNVDIWILALYFKLPIVFISQSLLIENGRNMMVLYGNQSLESYFFIHPFGVSQNVISRFGLVELKVSSEMSMIKIPLTAVTPTLRERISGELDADEPFTLEQFITTFKISNVKNKIKPVFIKKVAEQLGHNASEAVPGLVNESVESESEGESVESGGESESGGEIVIEQRLP